MKAESVGTFIVILSVLFAATLSAAAEDTPSKADPVPPVAPEPPKVSNMPEIHHDVHIRTTGEEIF